MTDWGQAFSNGFATGLAIIFAQKTVKWLDKHPLIKAVKKVVNDITHNRENL